MKVRILVLGIVMAVLLSGSAPLLADESIGAQMANLLESSFAQETVGNYDRALNDVLKLLRMDTENYFGNLRAAWLYYLKARYDDSIIFYKRAMALQPVALEPQLGLMLPLMASERWQEAEDLGERLLERAPNSYLVGSRLAYIYFSQGKNAKAMARYKAVLADYPSDTDMMSGLAWTYVRLGKKADARDLFETVLLIKKDDDSAKAGLKAVGGNEMIASGSRG